MSIVKGVDTKKIISFESISRERIEDSVKRFQNEDQEYIYRIEMVLTETCNLKCSYCQKRKAVGEEEERISEEALLQNIEDWGNQHCEYIHFTGGEPTLMEYLPSLVKLTSDKGIRAIITSNATADVQIYEQLVRNGLYGIHISLDTNDAAEFDRIVGVTGSFDKVMQTIHMITKLRDEEGYDVHLTLNSTVTPNTIHKLDEMLKFYLDLKPNDIKLMPISQLRKKWQDYSEFYYSTLYPKIKAMIPEDPNNFVMLRNRIQYLVENQIRGYHDYMPKQCYLMCHERLVGPDGKFYPCYINYRENGSCLGNINEHGISTQASLIHNASKGMCESEICSKFCADITARYNKCIDRVLSKEESLEVFF